MWCGCRNCGNKAEITPPSTEPGQQVDVLGAAADDVTGVNVEGGEADVLAELEEERAELGECTSSSGESDSDDEEMESD